MINFRIVFSINNPRRSRIHNFFDTHFDTQLFHMHNFFLVTVEGRVNLRIVPFEPTCCKRQWIEWIMGERYSDATHSFISQLMPWLVDWLGTNYLFVLYFIICRLFFILSGPIVQLTKNTFSRSQTDAFKHILPALLNWIEKLS